LKTFLNQRPVNQTTHSSLVSVLTPYLSHDISLI
jgi:hypothetical protein